MQISELLKHEKQVCLNQGNTVTRYLWKKNPQLPAIVMRLLKIRIKTIQAVWGFSLLSYTDYLFCF